MDAYSVAVAGAAERAGPAVIKVEIAGPPRQGRHAGRSHSRRPDPDNGYQAAGSIGRRILEGEHKVKIFGDPINVNCEVRSIHGYSAHADTNQLLEFIGGNADTLEKVFVVQGEEGSSEVLAQKIKDELAIDAEVPKMGEVVEL